MSLQSFFESAVGQIITIVVILALFLIILISGKGKKFDTRALVTCAVFAALATALGAIKIFSMPQGGSITPLSMVPIVLAGYFFGLRRGIMTGMCVGLLNLIFNPYVIYPAQLLLDYPIAFGALAFGAFFAGKGKYDIIPCYLFGVFCRYICAVLSGIIFFGAYAEPGFNAVTWSLWYNLTYLGVEAAITTAILLVPAVRSTFTRLRLQALSASESAVNRA